MPLRDSPLIRRDRADSTEEVLSRGRDGSWLLSVILSPGARKHSVEGVLGDALKIRIAAPAVEDKANRALVEYLAETLQLPRRSVRLISGRKSRRKVLRIDGLDVASLRQRLSLTRNDAS